MINNILLIQILFTTNLQEEQLSINKMNFLVQNLQDVKELYKDEKKYWLLNNK